MKLGDIYKTNYTGHEELEVIRIYSEKLGAVKVGNKKNKILFSYDAFSEPSLCLAHVNNSDTLMKKIQKEHLLDKKIY